MVSPSNGLSSTTFAPKQKKLVPLAPKDSKETGFGTNGPQVHVYTVEQVSPPVRTPQVLDSRLMAAASDEAGTQVSSSSGSGKPPSTDGKSVTSGTTYALDEKESLRPDDSASVKATEDEDVFSPPGSGVPGSHVGSEDEVRAFRDQLREISCMDPPGQSNAPPDFARNGSAPHGVLYVPPQGSGVGTIPTRDFPGTGPGVDFPPDPKLLEALDSPKDRIMVLKLEQDIVDFVKDAKESSLKLPQTNAFYRMLAHKLADYYMLGHIVDDSTMAVCIYKTPTCRLPPPLTGIATPSTAASTPPPLGPQMKILRRGMDPGRPNIVNGSGTPSKSTSENGDSGNDDDRKPKLPASREEREARYEAARKRIMGSAKPPESPEEPLPPTDSRSSSAAEKKFNRKKRVDSDDDFEARSAYSAYYPPGYSSGGPTPTSFSFPNNVDTQSSQMPPPCYGNQQNTSSQGQYSMPANTQWSNQAFGVPASSNWMPQQQSAYDISGDFQRAMAFPPTAMGTPSPTMPHGFAPSFHQQYSMPPQTWQQQHPYTQAYPPQASPQSVAAYPQHPPSSTGAFLDAQGYQYGQLPSQAFPGRQPNNLEHPLPGSYKSKHFNPQSQSFVPGQPNGKSGQRFVTSAAPTGSLAYGAGYGMPAPLQRQVSSTSQKAAFGPAQVPARPAGSQRAPSGGLTHPLPQPVFPRQPSPNVPLPSKPEATPPRLASDGPSSLAKWGTPASLPAKPPPSVEPFDAAKYAQTQQQPSSSSGRLPTAMPNFGSMPPLSGGHGLGGHGVQSSRRA